MNKSEIKQTERNIINYLIDRLEQIRDVQGIDYPVKEFVHEDDDTCELRPSLEPENIVEIINGIEKDVGFLFDTLYFENQNNNLQELINL